MAVQYAWKSGILMPRYLFFLLKIDLAAGAGVSRL
jgi:hypothetical protein